MPRGGFNPYPSGLGRWQRGRRGEYRPTFLQRIRHVPNREGYHELCSPEFYRELNSFAAVVSDEFVAGLDPDDLRLIEQLRHGALCPTNGIASAFTQEHLDYWTSPYAVEPGVTRRLGNGLIIPAEREERRRARLAREQERVERRELSEEEKAQEAAELARAQAEWDIEQEAKQREREQRLKQTMQADMEWEASAKSQEQRVEGAYSWANPFHGRWSQRSAASLLLPKRHYVPEWKLQEQAREKWEERAGQRDEVRRKKAEAAVRARLVELEREHEKAAVKAAAEAKKAARLPAAFPPVPVVVVDAADAIGRYEKAVKKPTPTVPSDPHASLTRGWDYNSKRPAPLHGDDQGTLLHNMRLEDPLLTGQGRVWNEYVMIREDDFVQWQSNRALGRMLEVCRGHGKIIFRLR